jgi:hypothetical protein
MFRLRAQILLSDFDELNNDDIARMTNNGLLTTLILLMLLVHKFSVLTYTFVTQLIFTVFSMRETFFTKHVGVTIFCDNTEFQTARFGDVVNAPHLRPEWPAEHVTTPDTHAVILKCNHMFPLEYVAGWYHTCPNKVGICPYHCAQSETPDIHDLCPNWWWKLWLD